MDEWDQFAAAYRLHAEQAPTAVARHHARGKARRYQRLASSLQQMLANGQITLHGGRVHAFTTSVDSKRCCRCGQHKPISRFARDIDSPDGRRAVCRTCMVKLFPP